MSKPIHELYIELTNTCNCSCVTCPQSVYKKKIENSNGYNRDKGFMDAELFRKIVSQSWELTDTINFSYFGEHTIHPRFSEFILMLANRPKGTRVHIFTNFLFMKRDQLDAIVSAKVSNMNISLDAVTSETYDKVRRGGTIFDLDGNVFTDNRFSRLVEKVQYWFGRKDHISTRHEYTVSHFNYHEADKFVEKWKPILSKNDTIVLKNVLTYGGIMKNEPLVRKNACNIWGGSRYLVVSWDGRVGPCFLDTNMDLSFGSINESDFKNILYSDRYQNVKNMSLGRSIYPCKSCIDADNHWNDRIVRRD